VAEPIALNTLTTTTEIYSSSLVERELHSDMSVRRSMGERRQMSIRKELATITDPETARGSFPTDQIYIGKAVSVPLVTSS